MLVIGLTGPTGAGKGRVAELFSVHGLPVIDAETKNVYGTLGDVINTGASDIYVIKTENGEKMMPAVPEFVKEVDTEVGIFVTPIEGIFD